MLLSTAPPSLQSWGTADGTNQRSLVSAYIVQFNEPVTLAPGAVSIAQLQTNTDHAVVASTDVSSAVRALNPSGDGETWAVSPIPGGSLDDGRGFFRDAIYQLSLNPAGGLLPRAAIP